MVWINRVFWKAKAVLGRVRSCARLPKKWAAKNAKGTCKCEQSRDIGTLRSKIWHKTNSRRLQESVRRNRPKICPYKWILHHNNTLAHDVLRIQKFLAKKSITKIDHPPYSPELAPCNFWLFPKLKNVDATWCYCEVLCKMIFKSVSNSGTIVSQSA
jgi:hypothetical protein